MNKLYSHGKNNSKLHKTNYLLMAQATKMDLLLIVNLSLQVN